MRFPIPFKDALECASKFGISYRQRLRLDELQTLCAVMHNCKSYIEVGVYDGFSAYMIGATTCVERMYLIDLKISERTLKALDTLAINVKFAETDFRSAIMLPHSDWCLLDADHSYEATKDAYLIYKQMADTIVLHDVEMPGPKQLFYEVGGVRIVSSDHNVHAPDGKLLPPLGYGILAKDIYHAYSK